MKVHLLLLCSFLAPLAAPAAETAYTALRVVGKKDREALNRVLEVRGRNGTPQPEVWKITVEEPQARGGLREYEVQRGRIIAQRTPTSRSYGGVMNFGQLNLDSDGAFTIVNQEAEEQGIVFSRMEYLLRAGTGGGAPVWQLDLFDGSRSSGRMTVAADSGAILDRQMRSTGPAPDSRSTRDSRSDGERRDYAERDEDRDLPPVSDGRWSERGEKFRSVEDFFHRLGKRFERRSDQLKKFFVGDEPR
jgi:hypothetical protein